MSPLDFQTALPLEMDLVSRYGQLAWPCFGADGAPSLLLETYYPRVALALPIAVASVFASAWLVLVIPVLVMAALGGLWGWLVGAPANRPLWLRWVALFVPVLSFAWVLWLGSLMTEGIYVLLLLAAVCCLWLSARGRVSDTWCSLALVVVGVGLLLTRDSWPIAGIVWGFALECLLRRASAARFDGRQRGWIAVGRFALSQMLGLAAALLASRWFAGVVTPNADFPASNEPPTTIPANPSDFLFTLRVSLDSLLVGIRQSSQLFDVVSILLVVAMPVLLLVVLFRASWRAKFFVAANWLLSMTVVGIVSLCCGGLNSYFRYQIPAMFVTLAVAWLPWSRESVSEVKPGKSRVSKSLNGAGTSPGSG